MQAVLSLSIVALLLLPPGYAILRLAGSRSDGLARLALAFGLGWSSVLPLSLLELALGVRGLVPLASLACLGWLRPGRAGLHALRGLAPGLAMPLAFGALVYCANASDFERHADGASLRLGFDTADRATYALVGDELQRALPQRLENPLFAPVPLRYSLFPSAAGVLLRRYGGFDPLQVFMSLLPAIGAVFVGLAVAGLLEQWGAKRSVQILTTLLMGLGGDLSFLTETTNRTGLERAAHFFAFHSFSAESLLYNPWVFGLPLALTALIAAERWLCEGGLGELALAGLLMGALWQTKVFAFLALLAGALAAGALLRHTRLAALAAASLLGAGPWICLTAISPAGRGGWPLIPELLRPVRRSLQDNTTLHAAASSLGDGLPLLLLGTLLFLIGGFGVRLLGLPRLLRAARADGSGLWGLLLATIAASVVAALSLRGHPMAVDGIQFLTFAQYLLWLPTGLTAGGLLARRRWLATSLVGLALVSPSLALARKLAPERLTSPQALDRVRLRLGSSTVRACAWLQAHSAPGDRVVLPLTGDPEDVGALKPLFVAALARRRVSAYNVPLSVDLPRVAQRAACVARIFGSSDPADVDDALEQLKAQWVWEDARRPLAAVPPGWERHEAATGIVLWRRQEASHVGGR